MLSSLREGDRVRYRCHTGHAFSADSLLEAVSASIGDSLWNATRAIKECIWLLNHMGDHFAEINRPGVAALFFKKAREAEDRMKLVWRAAVSSEELNTAIISGGERAEEDQGIVPGRGLQQQ